jgi:hypothetical protein
VDNQAEDSSKIKTHEEILKLFHEVRSVEAKIKNPGEIKKEPSHAVTVLREIKPPVQISRNVAEEQQPLVPTGEIAVIHKERIKKSFLKKIDTPELPTEKKTHWFDFFKLEKNDIQEPGQPVDIVPKPEEVQPFRSTFILELDTAGNLTGFPLKKPHREKKTQPGSGDTEEPVKGIKGKLQRLTARFRSKKSEESESTGGISEKIKGIFRRKNKE